MFLPSSRSPKELKNSSRWPFSYGYGEDFMLFYVSEAKIVTESSGLQDIKGKFLACVHGSNVDLTVVMWSSWPITIKKQEHFWLLLGRMEVLWDISSSSLFQLSDSDC